MKSYIIGISGELNSGKDTLASMLNYIIAVGPAKANYTQWATKKLSYDETYKDRITHFADPMKDCLSIMFGIKREYFDDRVYKDEMYYVIGDRRFITEKDSKLGHCYTITIEMLKHFTLDQLIKDHSHWTCVIKIRTLMQYFGTEIGRDMLSEKLWVSATMYKAVDIAEARRVCIIPDVRFINEWKAITKHILYGLDIEIIRDRTDGDKHASETIDFKPKFPIQNNNTKMTLFYKAMGLVNHLLDK